MLIVQKFGGTSVGQIGSVERVGLVARHLLETQRRGHEVVAVCSAMAGETNRLVDLALQIHPEPFSLEYDMLLASGEQIAVALVALAIHAAGGKARPMLGHQLGIETDSVYSKARIRAIRTEPLRKLLADGVIPVIAGFQGVDADRNITTLGRGGSDTSAVAVAAALQADACEIYTDVDGVYTTDPRLCSRARKLESIRYEEMLELASLGAKVLQIRSVELAAKFQVPLEVRSAFHPVPGTRVVGRKAMMEEILVTGIAADANDVRITLSGLPEGPGVAYEVFGPIAEAAIVVDIIVQNTGEGGRVSLSFTVPQSDHRTVLGILESRVRSRFPGMQVTSDGDVAKVSIVGTGMRNHPGVAARMFQVLASSGIDIKLISTSEIKVSVLVDRSQMKGAVERLHCAFGLDEAQEPVSR
jgi:aspartate kinase